MLSATPRPTSKHIFGALFFALTGLMPMAQDDADGPATTTEPVVVSSTQPEAFKISAPSLELLQQMQAKFGPAKTVVGHFTQLKQSEIFLEEIESVGTFRYLKPDLFRCDYDPPDAMVNLIVEDAIFVYVPSIEQAERYRFRSKEERDQQLHVLMMGLGVESEVIDAEYEVTTSIDNAELREALTEEGSDVAKTILLRAVPRPHLIETSPFTMMKLWIDKETLKPRKIWFEDYNGDQTSITIQDVKFDEPLEQDFFRPKFPPGTEIIDKTEI